MATAAWQRGLVQLAVASGNPSGDLRGTGADASVRSADFLEMDASAPIVRAR